MLETLVRDPRGLRDPREPKNLRNRKDSSEKVSRKLPEDLESESPKSFNQKQVHKLHHVVHLHNNTQGSTSVTEPKLYELDDLVDGVPPVEKKHMYQIVQADFLQIKS